MGKNEDQVRLLPPNGTAKKSYVSSKILFILIYLFFLNFVFAMDRYILVQAEFYCETNR